MSVACMTWVFSHSTAGGADRLLLLAIADHAGDDGRDAWPSVPTLARKTGTSERSVQRGISRLEAGGHLVVERCQGRGGTNRYAVVMAPTSGVNLSPPDPTPAAPDRCQPVTGDDLTPVTELRHQGGDSQASPERPERPSSPQPPAARPRRGSRADGTNPRALRAADDRQRQQHAVDRRAAERDIRRRVIAACIRCSADGYLPGGAVCDHDPETPARAARGIALVRAELARRDTSLQLTATTAR